VRDSEPVLKFKITCLKVGGVSGARGAEVHPSRIRRWDSPCSLDHSPQLPHPVEKAKSSGEAGVGSGGGKPHCNESRRTPPLQSQRAPRRQELQQELSHRLNETIQNKSRKLSIKYKNIKMWYQFTIFLTFIPEMKNLYFKLRIYQLLTIRLSIFPQNTHILV
jgi:hypothetical protein